MNQIPITISLERHINTYLKFRAKIPEVVYFNMQSKTVSNSEFGWFLSFVLAISSNFFSEKVFWSQTFLILSLIFALFTILELRLLSKLNLIWQKLGKILGYVSNPIILGTLYFVLLTPISMIMRVLRRDELKLKFNDSQSYWVDRQDRELNLDFFRRQF